MRTIGTATALALAGGAPRPSADLADAQTALAAQLRALRTAAAARGDRRAALRCLRAASAESLAALRALEVALRAYVHDAINRIDAEATA